jgi:capsular polysaccharide biosynthesis protein
MDGLSVVQQAALWSRATVVLHMHGAALGNYLFLPRLAVAVQLAAMPDRLNPTRYSSLLVRAAG